MEIGKRKVGKECIKTHFNTMNRYIKIANKEPTALYGNLYWPVVTVNLTQLRVTWGGGTPNEEFLDKTGLWRGVGGTHF